MSITTRPMTLKDFEALDDYESFELIEGELHELASTKVRHVIATSRFGKAFVRYSDSSLLGEALIGEGGFAFEGEVDSLLAPDVAFMRLEKIPPKNDWDDWFRVAPDAVVEVKSPSNTRKEIARKVAIYLAGGVSLVFVADPDHETITAHYADGSVRVYRIGDILDGGDVLPGFKVPVAEIFP
jgi:Uma2 family endonuclease